MNGAARMHDGHRPFRAPLRGNLQACCIYVQKRSVPGRTCRGARPAQCRDVDFDVVCKAKKTQEYHVGQIASSCVHFRLQSRCPRSVRPLACAPPAPNAVVAVLTLQSMG